MTSTFESCLIRYHVIGQRLVYSDFVLDKLAPKLDPANIKTIFTEDEKEEAEKLHQELWEYALTSRICFDFNVVQLYSLLEAHQDMLTHLITKPQQDLENSLKDAWEVIKNQETRICKWRNNHTAHGKSFAPDGSFIVMPDIDPDYLQGQIDIFKASKCAIIYINGFLQNTSEYLGALSSYQSKVQGIKSMTNHQYLQIDVSTILSKVQSTLKNNNLKDNFRTKLHFV